MSFNSKQYWETRYKQNGTSGLGSYNTAAAIKANYINSVITKYEIKTINDFGHGDGNQIGLLTGFENYTGYDVSKTIRNKCIEKYKEQPQYSFISDYEKFIPCDLVMSLDVIYHIIEEDIYINYINNLFTLGKYVLIYAVDKNETPSEHVKFREFTGYISMHFQDFTLIETAPGYHKDVNFFLYKKNN